MNSAFSIDLGLSEEQGALIYERMLRNDDWRRRISSEINQAFSDENFSWARFFDEHDIYSTESESDARLYAEKIILAPLKKIVKG